MSTDHAARERSTRISLAWLPALLIVLAVAVIGFERARRSAELRAPP